MQQYWRRRQFQMGDYSRYQLFYLQNCTEVATSQRIASILCTYRISELQAWFICGENNTLCRCYVLEHIKFKVNLSH